MTELDMTPDAETEGFTDELSDEALDREAAGASFWSGGCASAPR